MATPPETGGDDSRGGSVGKGRYRKTFEEGHSYKQPLLVKSCDGDVAAGRPNAFDFGYGVLEDFTEDVRRRSSSWKTLHAAERERFDAAEARGYGFYSLHAVIGQGGFGRIHLASWQHRGGGVDSIPASGSTVAADDGGAGAAVTVAPASATSLCAAGGGGDGIDSGADGGCDGVAGLRTRAGKRDEETEEGLPGKARDDCSFASKERLAFKADVGGASAAGTGTGWETRGTPRHDRRRSRSNNSGSIAANTTRRSSLFPAGIGRWARPFRDKNRRGIPEQRRCRSRVAEENDRWVGAGEEDAGGDQLRLRALKSVCKRKVTEKGLARHIETELAVLKQCSHPFIVSLSPGGQFQTSRHLHLVLNYCPGGDLFSLLGRVGRLSEPQVRVCAAQLSLALRHLHSKHIAYRDLKPDNVCLDARGQAILVDFSLARTGLDEAPEGKTFTFCGSAAYAAPEIISKEGHDTRVDLWSLGCVVFEALVGENPFRRRRGDKMDRQALFARIQRGHVDFPSFISATALSFLKGLLSVSPDSRPGFSAPSHLATSASTPTCLGTGGEALFVPRNTAPQSGAFLQISSSSVSEENRPKVSRNGLAARERRPRSLLLEHEFFRGLPGWGGPGTGGAWDDAALQGSVVAIPALSDAFDVRHFDSRFTSQAVELSLQGHPHKGGPTPAFDGFEWRGDDCIEYAQVEDRRLFESLASALWC